MDIKGKISKGLGRIMIVAACIGVVPAGAGYLHAQDKPFTIVIDPGHGGKDTGATGTGKYKKEFEKDIVLSVGLMVRDKLKKQMPDVKVIMTRDTDKFVELFERGAIANRAQADLFVSIHANSAGYKAEGTETYVLGIHRNKTNLEVAKRENAVILLEDDYETNYDYDPNAPESVIGLTLMQEDFLEMSKRLAHLVEESYGKVGKRKNRGVKQAGFIVLHQTYMPSILTEIGFLSNSREEVFLHSKKGQEKIAASIVDGIIRYKDELDKISNIDEPGETDTISEKRIIKGVTFKVQIASAARKVETVPSNFKGLKGVEAVKVGKYYKYYYGKTSDYNQIVRMREEAVKKGYEGAFVVAFKGKERLSVRKVLQENSGQ